MQRLTTSTVFGFQCSQDLRQQRGKVVYGLAVDVVVRARLQVAPADTSARTGRQKNLIFASPVKPVLYRQPQPGLVG